MATCFNKNLPEYKALFDIYGDDIVVSGLISAYQKKNNTEGYPSVLEAAAFRRETQAAYSLKKSKVVDSVYMNLHDKGLIVKKYGNYYIKGGTEVKRSANILAARAMMHMNGIPKSAISVTKDQYGFRVTVNGALIQDDIRSSKSVDGIFAITVLLEDRFPNVQVEVVDETKAKQIYDSIPEEYRKEVKFSDINSFYFQGKSYLIQGRVTNETAIEEMLHPLVDAIKKDNAELYNGMLQESKNNFPALYQTIMADYNESAKFTKEDREVELVTQALSRHFRKEYELTGGVTKSYLQKLNELVRWFANAIKDLLNSFAGSDLQVTVKDVNPNLSLSEIADMLLTDNIKFNFDVEAGPVKYSIQQDLASNVKSLMRSGTPIQRQIIEDIVLNDGMNIKLVKQDENGNEVHYYAATAGEFAGQIFDSVTYSIKGEFSDDRKTENFSRLFGNQFDQILEDIAARNSKEKAIANAKALAEREGVQGLTDVQLEEVYVRMQDIVTSLSHDGTILIPQVVIGDANSSVAGSIDLLAISPEGDVKIYDLKVSKYEYSDRKFPVYEGSKLGSDTELTTKEAHAIQVNSYKRIIENMGYKVSGTYTINVTYTPKTAEDGSISMESFRLSGYNSHAESSQSSHVNTIVEKTNDGVYKNELNYVRSQEFIEDEAPETQKIEDDPLQQPETWLNAYNTLNQFVTKLYTRKEVLETFTNESRKKAAKSKAINALSVVLSQIETDLKGADPSNPKLKVAISTVLRYAEEDVETIMRYLSDAESVKEDRFATVLRSYQGWLQSYDSLQEMSDVLSSEDPVKHRLDKFLSRNRTAIRSVEGAYKNFAKYVVANTSARGEFFAQNPEELEKLVTETEDIGTFRRETQSPTASSDTLSVTADRIFKRKLQEVRNKTKEVTERAAAIGNNLIEASKKNGISEKDAYDFMLGKDSDGKLNGRYVSRVSSLYKKIYKQFKEPLEDESGNMLKLSPLKNAADNPELAEKNKKIYTLKKQFRAFLQAEKVDDSGKPIDGDYHKYSDQFKAVRSRYETWSGRQWIKRSDVTDLEYQEYRLKYYDQVRYMKAVTIKGEPTGAVEESVSYFVKRDHVQVRDAAADGTKLTDERWEKIQNDSSELGRARKEFYDFFIQEYENFALQQLPRDVRNSMLGHIGRVKNQFVTRVIKSPSEVAGNMWAHLGPNVRSMFQTSYYAKASYNDENGDPIETAPIMFVGDLRSERRIQKLDEKIQENSTLFKEKKITIDEFSKENDRLQALKNLEINKLDVNEIETDLTKNLIAFRQMSENYESMMEIEDTLLALQKTIENREYTPKGGKFRSVVSSVRGQTTKTPQKISGKDSNVAKRYKMWMKMSFYNEKAFEQTAAEKVTKKLMGYTSLTFLGFNPFSAVNNLLYGNISNMIEAAGGQFFDRSAYGSSTAEFNTQAVPGFLSAMGTAKGYYGKKRDGSKFAAAVNHFNMVRSYQSGEGRASVPEIFDFAYAMSEGGEYAIQSKVGVAILKSTMIKKNDGTEEISVYDAFTYDNNTGEFKLMDGYELSKEQMADISLKIYRVNEYIHGNYAPEDKMVMQNHFIGELAAQFHKWVIPGLDARFRESYHDEYLGEVEGRYRTFGRFMNYLYKTTGDIEATKAAFTENELKNMYKVLAEIGFFLMAFTAYAIFKNLRDDADDDDEGKFTKRMLGALQYQASRLAFSELVTYIDPTEYSRILTNPFASSRMIRDFADVATQGGKYLYYNLADGLTDSELTKKLYYTRGSRKGQLKLKKEFYDVAPLLKQANRWVSFDTVEDFYVRQN